MVIWGRDDPYVPLVFGERAGRANASRAGGARLRPLVAVRARRGDRRGPAAPLALPSHVALLPAADRGAHPTSAWAAVGTPEIPRGPASYAADFRSATTSACVAVFTLDARIVEVRSGGPGAPSLRICGPTDVERYRRPGAARAARPGREEGGRARRGGRRGRGRGGRRRGPGALEAAVAAGRAAGAKGTFMVAPAGREWLDEQYPEAFAGFRADPAATETYERFERINRELLALFTDWQMVPTAGGERIPNDHADPEYDTEVIDRLGAQHERAERCSTLRRARAAARPVQGARSIRLRQGRWRASTNGSAGARIDSYHTVWFELHEDLLRMLGREREEATCDRGRRPRRRPRRRDGAEQARSVGNKGAQHRLDAQPRPAGAAGVLPADRGVPPLPRRRRRARRRRSGRRSSPASRGSSEELGPQLRRRASGRCSSRSARAPRSSMPGMMDTVLNLGITDEVEAALARLSGDAAFARQTHCRFVHQFGDTVLGADIDEPGRRRDPDEVRAAVRTDTRRGGPDRPARAAAGGDRDRLRLLVLAPRQGLPPALGDLRGRRHRGDRPGDGLRQPRRATPAPACCSAATRSPATPEPYGEWLPRGQGEDVVSGTHDPLPLDALADSMPDAHERLLAAAKLLEREHGDIQDVEFTVERGELYLLQTRSAKRSPLAAVRAAVDLADEGAIEPRRGDRPGQRRAARERARAARSRARRAAAPRCRARRRRPAPASRPASRRRRLRRRRAAADGRTSCSPGRRRAPRTSAG